MDPGLPAPPHRSENLRTASLWLLGSLRSVGDRKDVQPGESSSLLFFALASDLFLAFSSFKEELEAALAAHEKANPQVVIKDLDGNVIEEATPIDVLLIADDSDQLEVHPDAQAELPEIKGA